MLKILKSDYDDTSRDCAGRMVKGHAVLPT